MADQSESNNHMHRRAGSEVRMVLPVPSPAPGDVGRYTSETEHVR